MKDEILAHLWDVVIADNLPVGKDEIEEAANRVATLLGDILDRWDARLIK